jgi:hypothetical protein
VRVEHRKGRGRTFGNLRFMDVVEGDVGHGTL